MAGAIHFDGQQNSGHSGGDNMLSCVNGTAAMFSVCDTMHVISVSVTSVGFLSVNVTTDIVLLWEKQRAKWWRM